MEGLSSCLVPPPTRLPVKDSENVHTQRCIQSIEAQLQFLVLPVKPIDRSPFTICMSAASTHTLLSAIKALYSGRKLVVARHQLRLVVGYIKTLAKVWSQGRKNLEEIQQIAQEVLSTKSELKERTPPENRDMGGQKTPGIDLTSCIEGGLADWSNSAMTLENPDSLATYWNLGNEFQSDIPIWFSSY